MLSRIKDKGADLKEVENCLYEVNEEIDDLFWKRDQQ
jgi:hypothetical protein